jgi:hypothetical protein
LEENGSKIDLPPEFALDWLQEIPAVISYGHVKPLIPTANIMCHWMSFSFSGTPGYRMPVDFLH